MADDTDDGSSLYTVPRGGDVAPNLPQVDLPDTGGPPQRPRVTVTPRQQTSPPPPPPDAETAAAPGTGNWWDKYPDIPKAAAPPPEPSPSPSPQQGNWWDKYQDAATAPPPPSPMAGAAEAGGYGALDALTFGAAPALAGVAHAGGEGSHPVAYDIYKALTNAISSNPDPQVAADYERGRQDYLRGQQAAQAQHPVPYLVGQLGANLFTPGFGAMRAGTLAGRMGAGALAGGIGGGLYGAGTAIGEGQSLPDVGRGALTGAVTGAALGAPLGAVFGPRIANPNSPGRLAAQTAENIGAPLPIGLVSDNPAVRGVTARLQSIPLSGTQIRQRVLNTQEQAGKTVSDLATTVAGGPTDRAASDAIVRPALEDVIDDNKQHINNAYDYLRSQIDTNQHYTLPSTDAALNSIMADRKAAGWENPALGLGQFRNLAAGATFNGAHRARVDARDASNILAAHPGYNKADYRRLTKALTQDLRGIVQAAATNGNPAHALDAFDAAEQQFGRLAEQNDTLRRVANAKGEGTIAQLLGAAQEKGGNIALINQIRGTPAASQVAGVLLRELGQNKAGEFSLATLATKWGNISDRAKQALFDPAHLQSINDIVGMARHIKGALRESNTSHTASVLILEKILELAPAVAYGLYTGDVPTSEMLGVAGAAGAYGLARLLASRSNSQVLAAWSRAYRALGQGPTPVRTAAFAEATRNLGHMLGVKLDPAQWTPQQQTSQTQRASGGRIPNRKERVRQILERHGVDESAPEKRIVKFFGLPVEITTPRGTRRFGTGSHGQRWSSTSPCDIGRIGNLSVCLGPYIRSEKVYLIRQNDAETGKFDEIKIALGYNSRQRAIDAYLRLHGDERGGERFAGSVEMNPQEFREWLANGDPTRPLQRSWRYL